MSSISNATWYSAPAMPVRRSSSSGLSSTASFEQAVALVRPGGHVANIGVRGEPATLHLEREWSRDITITTGLVDTVTISTLLDMVRTRQIDARKFITHHFREPWWRIG